MQRERTSTDAATSSAVPNGHDLDQGNQVPIESDADAGFASRTRRIKAQRHSSPAVEAFGNGPDSSRTIAAAALRRRRIYPKVGGSKPGRRPSEVIFDPPPPDTAVEDEAQDMDVRHASAPATTAVPSPARAYAAIGDTFRNVRATSMSAFAPLRSRLAQSITGTTIQEPPTSDDTLLIDGLPTSRNPGTAPLVPQPSNSSQHSRRSHSSISRWFGAGGDESSESEDEILRIDEGEGEGEDGGSAASRSPEAFGGRGLDEAIEDDEEVGSGSETEGESASPPAGSRTDAAGGERVAGRERAGRDGLRATTRTGQGDATRRMAYSPPEQDQG